MAVRTALFRLLLATILVFNGIASAMAAVHHAAAPALAGAVTESIAVKSVAPAAADGMHGDCGEPDPMFAGHDSPGTGGPHSPGHPPQADCCEPGTCQGTCATTGVPALPSLMHRGFDTPGQAGARPTASWHAAPALPHLMRPPIA